MVVVEDEKNKAMAPPDSHSTLFHPAVFERLTWMVRVTLLSGFWKVSAYEKFEFGQEGSEVRFTSVGSLCAGYVLTSKTLALAWLPSLQHLVTALCPYGFRLEEGDWQPHNYWLPGAALSLWFLCIFPLPLQTVSLLSSQNSQFGHALCFCCPWLTSTQGKTKDRAQHTPSTPYGHLQSKEWNTRWICGLTIDFIIWVLLFLTRWCGFTLMN